MKNHNVAHAAGMTEDDAVTCCPLVVTFKQYSCLEQERNEDVAERIQAPFWPNTAKNVSGGKKYQWGPDKALAAGLNTIRGIDLHLQFR